MNYMCSITAVTKSAKVVVAAAAVAAKERPLWRPRWRGIFDKALQSELIGRKFFYENT